MLKRNPGGGRGGVAAAGGGVKVGKGRREEGRRVEGAAATKEREGNKRKEGSHY